MLHNEITVKAEIERSFGKSTVNPAERFEMRFWLEMPVNGKTAMSRGTVITVEQPSLADARQFARQKAAHTQSKLYHWILDQGIANVTPKDAANKLPELLGEVIQDEIDWQKAIEELNSNQ